ncbi:TfpX/TfpZ family type IV pilin accessory protein [uncultured Psychrobacter sp.]|uniref:TfpX/TfpZ family type IV pilin accessory protein n=1 Tax=uncultured Psychrobacter sp. TaxID=259303 RepID=UPI003458BA79
MAFRLKVFGIHIFFSLIITLISLYIVFFVWYPMPLHSAAGVTKIVSIMLASFLIIGPVLTFFISKPNKKTLRFDLITILLLQISTLVYGLYYTYDGRPVWIAYNTNSFDVIWNNNIDNRKLAEALPRYQHVKHFGPEYVATIIPKKNGVISNKLLNEFLLDEFNHGIVPSQRPELYRPLYAANTEIINRAKNIEELYDYNNQTEVDSILSKYPEAEGFLPLKASALDMVVLISKQHDSKVVKIVDLRPQW